TVTAPLLLKANNNTVAAQTNAGLIVLQVLPDASGSSIYFGQVGSLDGLSSGGSGNIAVLAPGVDVFIDSLSARDFYFTAGSIEVDSAVVNMAGGQTIGTIDITSPGDLVIGNSFPGATGYGLDAGSGTIFLTVTGNITQISGGVGLIKTSGLAGIEALGGLSLTNTGNAIGGQLQLASLGSVNFFDSIDAHLLTGVSVGTFTVQSAANIYLDQGATVISVTPSGDAVVLAAANAFINNAGPGGTSTLSAAALQASNGQGLPLGLFTEGGRFLIYSASPDVDTLGGLTSGNDPIYGTAYPAPVAASGSRFVFASAATGTTPPPNNGSGTPPPSNSDTLIPSDNLPASPVLNGFVISITKPQALPPPAPPPSTLELILATVQLAPPPLPPPPSGPLADLYGDGGQSEPSSSSDQAASYVAASLDGGAAPPTGIPGAGSGGVIIPRFLTATVPPVPGTLSDTSVLSGFGNSALWQ
ncbi:MAG TPA: hypothetical protein VGC16_05780, partial [Rhizomicrobium sp.]